VSDTISKTEIILLYF